MKRRNFLGTISVVSGGTVIAGNPIPGVHSTMNANRAQENPDTKALEHIHVTVPSVVKAGEEFGIGIRMLTKPFFTDWLPVWERHGTTVNGAFNKSSRGILFMDNVLPQWEGEISIMSDDDFVGIKTYSFKDNKGTGQQPDRAIRKLNGFRFNTPGIRYIRIRDTETGMEVLSNPVSVEANDVKERLFWGNLHCHSIFGDGIRLPEDLYWFARNETFLDIFALTDHTEALTDAQWGYFRQVANDCNEDRAFVTFLGGEWTSPKYGHRNFIYPGEDGPIIRSSPPYEDSLEKLYAKARQHKALVIANHTASPGHTTRWENGHDPEVERLVEVYAIGGVNEMPAAASKVDETRAKIGEVKGSHVIDGLRRGFKLGMIGTGDDHDGRPGDSLHHLQTEPESYRFILGPGLMGVWAEELTRKSVFEALWNRRVYGTTNNRTILKFTVNGQPMGSELKLAPGTIKIHIETASNMPVHEVDVIGAKGIIKNFKPGKIQAVLDFEEALTKGDHWFYVRVKTGANHLAWSSPVWVSCE